MEKIVLASGNAKKLAEMQQLLAPLNIEVVAQSEFSVPEADETGTTFWKTPLSRPAMPASTLACPPSPMIPALKWQH